MQTTVGVQGAFPNAGAGGRSVRRPCGARAFKKANRLLNPRSECSDLLGLPFKIRVPIHPAIEMGRLVSEVLCGVVESTTKIREERQGVRAPLIIAFAASLKPVGDPAPAASLAPLTQEFDHLVDHRLHVVSGDAHHMSDVPTRALR
jgi:hypothetical protein